jgi:hypothetical protein
VQPTPVTKRKNHEAGERKKTMKTAKKTTKQLKVRSGLKSGFTVYLEGVNLLWPEGSQSPYPDKR